jgi:hypothetical protein
MHPIQHFHDPSFLTYLRPIQLFHCTRDPYSVVCSHTSPGESTQESTGSPGASAVGPSCTFMVAASAAGSTRRTSGLSSAASASFDTCAATWRGSFDEAVQASCTADRRYSHLNVARNKFTLYHIISSYHIILQAICQQ